MVRPIAIPHPLQAEMQLTRGPVQWDAMAGHASATSLYSGQMVLDQDGFVFRTPSGNARFRYRRGQAITLDLDPQASEDEAEIYLHGTIFGTVAWLCGLLPLHASSVAERGNVIAFTAASGGGKSTLAAALAGRGFDHVCDDTLLLDAHPDFVEAIPDNKPIKLWADALVLADIAAEREIAAVPGKYLGRPHRVLNRTLPLTDLIFLTEGTHCAFEPIHGIEKLRLLPSAFYRPEVQIALGDAAAHARFVGAIAEHIRFWRFIRPRTPEYFSQSTEFLINSLASR